MNKLDKPYGFELVLDLHNCDPATFTRKHIRNYFKKLCSLIDMERTDLHWWDDLHTPEEEKETEPHLKGTTAIQFIKTSNITIHTLDLLKSVYLNIFSCKDFDSEIVKQFTEEWFKGKIVNNHVIERK
ncbi:MAG: S-adenosylmethionine decarboxylase [Candidatus Scalinduaceae bacterium]